MTLAGASAGVNRAQAVLTTCRLLRQVGRPEREPDVARFARILAAAAHCAGPRCNAAEGAQRTNMDHDVPIRLYRLKIIRVTSSLCCQR